MQLKSDFETRHIGWIKASKLWQWCRRPHSLENQTTLPEAGCKSSGFPASHNAVLFVCPPFLSHSAMPWMWTWYTTHAQIADSECFHMQSPVTKHLIARDNYTGGVRFCRKKKESVARLPSSWIQRFHASFARASQTQQIALKWRTPMWHFNFPHNIDWGACNEARIQR